uniref:J domain-containing protein n=1 Tax=Syphacia muris TaxID=451379 RepID=A0A0N5ADM8_9BILA
MEANRLEAQRCVNIAREAIRNENSAKATKFLNKARKLDPSIDVSYLLTKAKKLGEPKTESSATGTDNGYGHYDQYEQDTNFRNRFHPSHSSPTVNTDKSYTDGPAESSSSSEKKRTRSRSAGRPQLGVHYTQEEVEIVERIRHCKDYYEILNVKRDATDSHLKKEYRKLALQLHPDKCRAPGATEAFKGIKMLFKGNSLFEVLDIHCFEDFFFVALGNAYAVLSNPEKRAQYDKYGTESPQRRSSSSDFYEYDYGRGFEAEYTAEEIFNMFFGGSYPTGHLNRRHQFHFHQQRPEEQEQTFSAHFLQLLPLLAILLLGLLAQFMAGEPAFSLYRTSKYSEERFTRDLRIPYYVKTDFMSNYRNKLQQVEHQVEDEYISQLRMNCYKERSQKETMAWRARTFGDGEMWNRAQRLPTPNCDRLQEIYS